MIVDYWAARGEQPPEPVAAAGVMASVLGLIQTHLVTERPEPLIELLGPLMGLVTSLYLDTEDVAREVQRGAQLAREIQAGADARWTMAAQAAKNEDEQRPPTCQRSSGSPHDARQPERAARAGMPTVPRRTRSPGRPGLRAEQPRDRRGNRHSRPIADLATAVLPRHGEAHRQALRGRGQAQRVAAHRTRRTGRASATTAQKLTFLPFFFQNSDTFSRVNKTLDH